MLTTLNSSLCFIAPHLAILNSCPQKPKLQHWKKEDYVITLPGTEGAIDVVESSDTTLHFEILCVMFTKLLSCQFLQAISILWLHIKNPPNPQI